LRSGRLLDASTGEHHHLRNDLCLRQVELIFGDLDFLIFRCFNIRRIDVFRIIVQRVLSARRCDDALNRGFQDLELVVVEALALCIENVVKDFSCVLVWHMLFGKNLVSDNAPERSFLVREVSCDLCI
jgi:hypothetical protein